MKSAYRFASVLISVVVLFLFMALVASAPVAQAQTVQVLSADPNTAQQGTVNLNVLVKGRGFKRGAIAKFLVTGTTDPGGVRVNSTTYVDATTLTANIDVADTAVLSKYDIQVAILGGRGGKGTELFSVTAKGGGNQACTLPDPILTAPTACTDGRSGCLDANFGTGGIAFSDMHGTGEAVAIQPWDGKIVAVGTAIEDGVGTGYGVVRYNPDGALDGGFGNGGIAKFPIPGTPPSTFWYARAVAIQPDGKIVVAGDGFWIMRLNPDGTPDTGFGTQGKTQLFATLASTAGGIALQSDGKIVVVGYGNSSKKQYLAYHIGRLTATGSPDTSFRNGGQLVVELGGGVGATVVIQRVEVGTNEQEKILVGGKGKNNSSTMNLALMRFNPDGTSDTTFGRTGDGVVLTDLCNTGQSIKSLALDAANNIVAAVSISIDRPIFAVARFTSDGVLDTGFGGKGKGFALANFLPGEIWDVPSEVAFQADGKILVGGYVHIAYGYSGLLRYNPDGTLDTSFGVGGAVVIYTGGSGKKIAIQPWDGKIVQAGYETLRGTAGWLSVVRFLP